MSSTVKPQHDFTSAQHRTVLTPGRAVQFPPATVTAAGEAGLTPDEARRALTALRGLQSPQHVIHPTAVVHPTATVWHYAVILADATIAEGVSIGSHCEIGRGAMVGAWSRIGKGAFLPPNTVVGERVFIGPHVVMCDDKHPRVPTPGIPSYFAEPPVIEDDAVIGAGAVILPGVRVGRSARVAAGALVTRDVEPFGFVRSEPAREHELSATARGKW